jgi:hypothetical protein
MPQDLMQAWQQEKSRTKGLDKNFGSLEGFVQALGCSQYCYSYM